MTKIIAVANQKGGVGKTTTAVNVAAGLGFIGKKTLLIDIDPQGNATSGAGIDKRCCQYTSYNLLLGQVKAEDVILKTSFNNLDIIASGIDLAAAELEIMELPERLYRLKNSIILAKQNYDYVIIDCPPSLGLITMNALTAADSILIPIQCEYFALEGLSQLMNTVRRVKRSSNISLDIEGILLTMYDGRLNLTQQVVSEIKQYFPRKVYSTVIPRTVRLSEAPSFGMPIMYYDKSSKGAQAYIDLVNEIIGKEENNGQ